MSKVFISEIIIIVVSLFHYVHLNVLMKQNPFLVQFCFQPEKLVTCYGAYVRPLYVIATDACSWRVNFKLFPENDLVMGPLEPPCRNGQHRKSVKTYVDTESLKYDQVGVSVVKLANPFALGNDFKLIDIMFLEKEETDCHLYELKIEEREEIRQSIRRLDIKIDPNDDQCYTPTNATDKATIIKCATTPPHAMVGNSPVICRNKLYAFTFEADEGKALIYLVASQGNWLSITVDGRTLRVAAHGNTSKLKASGYLIIVNVAVFHLIYIINAITFYCRIQ